MKQRFPPPDHCSTLHPNAGRRPCKKKEKTPCTSAPFSHTRNDRIKRHPTEIQHILSSLYRPYLQLLPSVFPDWFVPSLHRRWAESMRRAVYQWRKLTLRFYSSRVFPQIVLITGGSGLVREITEAAAAAGTRRVSAFRSRPLRIKERRVSAAVTAGQETLSVLRMRAGGGW